MLPKKSDRQRRFLCLDLLDQLDPRNHLRGMEKAITCSRLKDNFRPLNDATGRPEKHVRAMFGCLILKQIENLSDERVAVAWANSPYLRNFCGQQRFIWKLPCDPSEQNDFRRIKEDEVRKTAGISLAPKATSPKKQRP